MERLGNLEEKDGSKVFHLNSQNQYPMNNYKIHSKSNQIITTSSWSPLQRRLQREFTWKCQNLLILDLSSLLVHLHFLKPASRHFQPPHGQTSNLQSFFMLLLL
ncbi:hypothetical protein RYX36_020354 [Vicia faba]